MKSTPSGTFSTPTGPFSTPTRRHSTRRQSGLRRIRSRSVTLESEKCQEVPDVNSAPLPILGKIPNGSAAASLHLLSEEELSKLTLTNTKRNHGGHKGRFRSQMERVCRRLDNMAVEARLQQRQKLEALPVVEPGRAAAVDALHANGGTRTSATISMAQSEEAPSDRSSVGDSLDMEPQGEDCFDIEPATNESIFSGKSTKSAASGGGRPKSVRISTSVAFLEYRSTGTECEPISVSTCNRFQHPTRRDRAKLMRQALFAENAAFQKAKIRRSLAAAQPIDLDAVDKDETSTRSEEKETDGSPATRTLSAPRSSSGLPASSTPTRVSGGSKSSKSPSSGNAAYAMRSPNGPYGPRTLPK